LTRKSARNRLADVKSPYLLQHSENPVDWFPWGPEAFEKAKREDKPIFLSIGYSTCHWCHVMAHESFEDMKVADLMNDAFVSIKVDREERPDIDSVYMKVCQIMTGSGGWPLTIVMTPDKKPFFAATYIPRKSQFGRMGMLDLVPRIKSLWESRKSELLSSADQVIGALEDVTKDQPGEDLDVSTLKNGYEGLLRTFDEDHGGFRTAPKFPTPHNLMFLLRYWKRTGEEKALEMVEKTLQSMRLGGVYDHVGFGFHRYSTDPRWFLPHFEKMLYDQAMLAMAYTEACQATGNEEYGKTAHEIFTYVLRDMTSPECGFYSAEDADSEGEEGKFYLWSQKEIKEVLTEEEADLALEIFGTEKDGNFREEASGRKTGTNILHLKTRVPLGQAEKLEIIRKKLFDHREKRIHPHKDDKILTDWNGLMIAALAKGAQILGKDEYSKAATNAADFILKNMVTPDGTLLHRYREGEAAIQAHVDDYSFLIWGFLELYEATFDVDHLKKAVELNEELLRRFWDEDNGGLYTAVENAEDLIVRSKEYYDGAIPSGNSVEMLNLIRLARMTADPELEQEAARLSRAFSSHVESVPSAHTLFLTALDFAIGPSKEVVVVGELKAEDTIEMVRAIRSNFVPNKVVVFRPSGQKSAEIDRITGFTESHMSIDGNATTYVCTYNSCKAPTTDIEEMLRFIET
jgi:uncharacterized protein YyaL (SSP411 family)